MKDYPKPVIGLVGGIGSGKSAVADDFESLGCLVIRSDRIAHEVLEQPAVKAALRQWWGDEILAADGRVDRRAVARRTFNNPVELERLNRLVHPKVDEIRRDLMAAYRQSSAVKAVVWDTPLLVETGLYKQCDAIIFVNTPFEQRLARVQATRGWTADELKIREDRQASLDKKKEISDDVIDNGGDEAARLSQVRRVLSRILKV